MNLKLVYGSSHQVNLTKVKGYISLGTDLDHSDSWTICATQNTFVQNYGQTSIGVPHK